MNNNDLHEDMNTSLDDLLSMQKQMADSIGNGIFAYTFPEYKMLILNQEARRMFNYSVEDPNKFEESLMNSIIPEDIPRVSEASRRIQKPGDSAEYTFRSRIEGRGDIAYYKCHTRLLSFESGQMYIISSITDITEQKLTEKRLDEERRQYRNALAFGCESMFNIDLTADSISEPIISSDGTNLTEHLGIGLPARFDDLAEIWFSDDRIVSDSKDIDAIKSRQELLDRYNNGTSILDMEYHLNDGSKYFHILVLLYEIEAHVRASFIVYDVTSDRQEEKQRTAVINSLGQIYSSLFHYSLTDGRFTVYKASPDLAKDIRSGISYDDFRRIYADEILPEFREDIAEKIAPENIPKLLADTDSITQEYKRKNAGWCRAYLVAADRDENGRVTSVVFAGHTIEEQKQAEFAQQEALKAAYEAANLASTAKTNFLAAMSHDIRTPMNAIIGMTAIAGTHLDDRERVADCLSKINVSSKHLLGLINEVLDMSRIESGKIELQEEEINLPELIENLLTMSRPEAEKKNHSLTVSVHSIEHEDVIGDSQRIQQVFMNIMGNAVKYTPDGGKIHLTISEKTTNKPNIGCYEFVFRDNGIGISEDFIDRIFEPFARATEDARVEKIQGTGLGMPITRNIVQMMNGDIKVRSKLNEGSEFTVTLFLKLKTEDSADARERFADLPVLVADDDRDSGEYTCNMLCEIGINAEWVSSGEEAVSRTVKRYEDGNDFFALILDWKMPGMDGLETAKAIREKTGDHIPIIIISAYDWSEIEPEARAAGANAFISKPLFKSRVLHLFGELTEKNKDENAAPAPSIISEDDFTGKRALLVEDMEINAEIAKEILRMAGLEVELAVNGKEAADRVSGTPERYFDIIFMDIQMPVMNGYDAARAIRAMDRNDAKAVPIIAMTANAFAEDVAAAKSAGMNEHIAKPIDIKQLHAVLRKWLK